jgi:N-acetyltransferase 10
MLQPRKNLPPLLTALADRKPEGLHWLGTSFGCTQDLFNFWNKNGFYPVYLRLTPNDLTGEHSCIMVKAYQGVSLETVPNANWLDSFHDDFRKRFVSLLSFQLKHFACALPLSFLLDAKREKTNLLALTELKTLVTDFDLKRLESYASNLVDYHLILDLVPELARLFFMDRLDLTLTYTQAAILLAIGLQHKSVTDLEKELSVPSNQILALFNKAMRKISNWLRGILEHSVREEMAESLAEKRSKTSAMTPLRQSLASEVSEGGKEAQSELKAKQAEMLAALDLQKYAIGGNDDDWSKVLSGKGDAPRTISVKGNGEKTAGGKPKFEVSGQDKNKKRKPSNKGGKDGKKSKTPKK